MKKGEKKMKKRSKTMLPALPLLLLVVALTVGCPEPKIEYRDRWHDCNDPTHGLVSGECECEEVTPNVCDDLWACVTATSDSIVSVIQLSRDTCDDLSHNCSAHDAGLHETNVLNAYHEVVLDSWSGRNGGVHDITGLSSIVPIGLRDPGTGRVFSPCLTPAERTAAEDAAIAENNTIHSL